MALVLVDMDPKSGGAAGDYTLAYDSATGRVYLVTISSTGGVGTTLTEITPNLSALSGIGAGAKTLADVVTSLTSVLAKLSADPATQTTLAAVLAKLIAAPATEAKQGPYAYTPEHVVATTTSQSLAALGAALAANLVALAIQNVGTDDVWVTVGEAAVAGACRLIPPDGTFVFQVTQAAGLTIAVKAASGTQDLALQSISLI